MLAPGRVEVRLKLESPSGGCGAVAPAPNVAAIRQPSDIDAVTPAHPAIFGRTDGREPGNPEDT